MSFQLGQTVGGYEFVGVLDGSKPEVAYTVRNHLSQRMEALKVLPRASDDQERVERFLREIKVHAGLLHPNIVTFYNAAELDGQLVMTTELVDGITLAERMKAGPLRWSEAVSYIAQVLAALAYAHERGIVHRNVTPENIIITADATAKLTGFGLAKPLSAPNLTQVGSVLGELNYISPEQIQGRTIDARADLYSVGVVLYQALTGRLPFESFSHFQVMLAHVSAEPPSASSIQPGVPPQFDPILSTALTKDPSNRFQSAEQFRAHLESVADGLRGSIYSVASHEEHVQPAVAETSEPAASEHEAPAIEDLQPQPVFVERVAAAQDTSDLLPSFGVVVSTGLSQRQLVMLGVFSLLIGTLIALLLTTVRP